MEHPDTPPFAWRRSSSPKVRKTLRFFRLREDSGTDASATWSADSPVTRGSEPEQPGRLRRSRLLRRARAAVPAAERHTQAPRQVPPARTIRGNVEGRDASNRM